MWRAVSICVTTSMNPHEPIFPARCLTGFALEHVGSLTQETVAEPQAISSENLRRYLSSDEDTHWISTAAARAEGSERRTGKFHPAFARCSMRVPLLEILRTSCCRQFGACGSWSGDSHAVQPAETPVPTTPREGWRLSEGQDVWIRS
jgi:hypothetical protein